MREIRWNLDPEWREERPHPIRNALSWPGLDILIVILFVIIYMLG